MADYFTQFSCALDVGSTENAHRAIELYDALSTELANDGECSAGFFVTLDSTRSPSELWIRDDGGRGEPEHVLSFVKAMARSLGLKGRWGLQWSNTCSIPVLDTFAGGAVVIDLATGEVTDAVHTDAWLAARIDDDADSDPDRSR